MPLMQNQSKTHIKRIRKEILLHLAKNVKPFCAVVNILSPDPPPGIQTLQLFTYLTIQYCNLVGEQSHRKLMSSLFVLSLIPFPFPSPRGSKLSNSLPTLPFSVATSSLCRTLSRRKLMFSPAICAVVNTLSSDPPPPRGGIQTHQIYTHLAIQCRNFVGEQNFVPP